MDKILTDEKKKTICTILNVGGTRTMAAHYVGCHPRTLYNEARRDPEFAKLLLKKEASPEVAFLGTIFEAGTENKQWRAARWALEKMYPSRYGNRNPRMISPDEVRGLLEEVVSSFAKHVVGAKCRKKIREEVLQLEAAANLLPASRSVLHER